MDLPLSRRARTFAAALACAMPLAAPAQSTRPQVTWHWHMHQPIYWNDRARNTTLGDRYEYAWDSIVQKDLGAARPENDLREIFGKEDRVAAYQDRMRESLGDIGGHADSGASVSYSGALMENVASLGQAGQLGYRSTWDSSLKTMRGWTTTDGKPRGDFVNFSYHHALLALHNRETVEMELRLHQEKVRQVFGPNAVSKGHFPTEMAFSTRLIPILENLGIEWAIVPGNKIARACPDFPLQFGSGGENTDPPNRADQINPPGVNFITRQISRGCAPTHANPLSYQPAWAKYVDPITGQESRLIVVPSDQAYSWEDGYGCLGSSFLVQLEARNDPAQPSLVVLAHDGDNAFGGGFSYYRECVPNLANGAGAQGNAVTTIEQYLHDFRPAANRLIHVEDGAWVNADGDFGSPTFINWNYPPVAPDGSVDPENGWNEKIRDWAIFTETLNRVLTAQQISGHTPNLQKVMRPDSQTHPVDHAWHYHLGSLDSGNIYYGAVLDLEMKATLGANEAVRFTDPIIGDGAQDTTPPTIWLPQRHPYNPGGVNFGVQYRYQQFVDDGDFHIYTFLGEVSTPATTVLRYRMDADGANPLSSNQNETFAGGPEVGGWVELPMTVRAFPKGNVYNNPQLNFFEEIEHIADYAWVEVAGLRSVLIDYYVEATDARGNTSRSPIQHVWIGDGSGATGEDGRVTIVPDPPVRGMAATLTYKPEGGPLANAAQVFLHYGKNNWTTVSPTDPTMTKSGDVWEFTFTVDLDAAQIDLVFNNGVGVWDNNSGQDWHFQPVGEPQPSPTPSATPTPTATPGPSATPTATPGPSPTPTATPIPTPTGPAWVVPDPLHRGQAATLFYNPQGRQLQGASQVNVHWGKNNWAVVYPQDAPMTFFPASGHWRLDFTVDADATQIDLVFNDGGNVWDNNAQQDWHFLAVAAPTPTATATSAPTPAPGTWMLVR